MTQVPPTLSDTEATITTTAIRSPIVSTIPNVFLADIFLPASYPLVGEERKATISHLYFMISICDSIHSVNNTVDL